MKNVPIKFRWRDKNGKTFYSRFEFSCGTFGLWTSPAYHGEIDENSIAQLVGYDVNGEEIYEGDKIQDLATGDVITAKLCPCNFYEIGITTAYFEKVGTNND